MIDLTGENRWAVLQGDNRKAFKLVPDNSVDCVITSPPYWSLRDYHVNHQTGLELTPTGYVNTLLDIFAEVYPKLRNSGSLWVVIGDTSASYKDKQHRRQTLAGKSRNEPGSNGAPNRDRTLLQPFGLANKELVGIPWRFALGMQGYDVTKRGHEVGWVKPAMDAWAREVYGIPPLPKWVLREDIIWSKLNPLPESAKDRCTRGFEHIFHFTKRSNYYHNPIAFEEPRRDGMGTRWKRNVWHVGVQPRDGDHYSSYPDELTKYPILMTCPIGGTTLDPFSGTGTTGWQSLRYGRKTILMELVPRFAQSSALACRSVSDKGKLFVL